MAELVYAFDLKSNGETRTGSSPVPATTALNYARKSVIFFVKKCLSNILVVV